MRKRNKNERDHPSVSERAQEKRRSGTVELFETGSRIADPQPAKQELISTVLDDAVAIPNFDFNAAVRNAREYLDQVRTFVLANAMADCVLDERLKKKRRNQVVEDCRFSMNLRGETITEPLLLDPY